MSTAAEISSEAVPDLQEAMRKTLLAQLRCAVVELKLKQTDVEMVGCALRHKLLTPREAMRNYRSLNYDGNRCSMNRVLEFSDPMDGPRQRRSYVRRPAALLGSCLSHRICTIRSSTATSSIRRIASCAVSFSILPSLASLSSRSHASPNRIAPMFRHIDFSAWTASPICSQP